MESNSNEDVKPDIKPSIKIHNVTSGNNEEVIGYLSLNVYKEECSVDEQRLVEASGISTVTLPVNGVTSTLLQHDDLQLSDGPAAYIETISDQLDDGQNVAVQLEDGTTAFIRATHKDGLQTVQLQDGTTAYISHALDLDEFANGVLDSVEINSIALAKAQASSSVIRSGGPRITKAISLGEKAFRCPYEGCDRLYTTQHHLKVHERTHTGDRPFKCSSCKKAFATGYSLKSHTRVHTGEKPYKCSEEYCGKAFKTSGDLQKHLRTHTGERPFKCPYHGCERAFTTSNIRKVHMRIHTGERPYTCPRDGCDRTFASATNYKNHIRIHTGEKPYVCGIKGCGKKFTEYSSLYKHHVVHTPTKPYACNVCGRNYRQTSTLAMHKRSAHGITDIALAEDSPELGEQSEPEDNNQTQVDECQRIQVMVVDSNGEAQTLQVAKNEHLLEQHLQLTTAEHSNDVILSDTTSFATIQMPTELG